MKFDYIKQPSQIDPSKPWISRPIIPVRLSCNSLDIDVYALIDSGADCSVFDAEIAEQLGLDLESGRKQELYGASGAPIEVYYHTVKLQPVGAKAFAEAEVRFSRDTKMWALLGQADFFQHYQIKFERYKGQIEVKAAGG